MKAEGRDDSCFTDADDDVKVAGDDGNNADDEDGGW